MHSAQGPESRRLLEKLIREVSRSEIQAIDHPTREGKRLGHAAPVQALQAVAEHATAMRGRLEEVLHAHDLPTQRHGLGATLATLRHLVVDRVVDAERSFRTALLDLRHGLDVVKLLREIARREELFGVIRWCDDWIGARRTLVARVEAQLGWFADPARVASELVPAPTPAPVEASDAEDFEVRSEPGDSGLVRDRK